MFIVSVQSAGAPVRLSVHLIVFNIASPKTLAALLSLPPLTMTDRFEFDLVSDRSSSISRRAYSQRNVSSLQQELTKNRKMINMKTSTTTILNRTLSFKPVPVSK